MRPDHQILRAGGPVVHCLKMLISSPDTGFVTAIRVVDVRPI